MAIPIVCHSNTGNNRLFAEHLAERLQCGIVPSPRRYLEDDCMKPQFWISSAKGCFMAVNDVRTLQPSGSFAHDFAPGGRDGSVSVERFAIYLGDIVHTTWSDRQVVEFLEKRIRLLRPQCLRAPHERRPLGALLSAEFMKRGYLRSQLGRVRLPSASA